MKIHLYSSMLRARQQPLNKQIISHGLGCDGDRNGSNLCLPWNDFSDARMSPSGPRPSYLPQKKAHRPTVSLRGLWSVTGGWLMVCLLLNITFLCVLVFLCCLPRRNPNDCPAWADGWNIYYSGVVVVVLFLFFMRGTDGVTSGYFRPCHF